MNATTLDDASGSDKAQPERETVTSGIRALLPFAAGAIPLLSLSAVLAVGAAAAGLAPYWVVYQVALTLLAETPDAARLYELVTIALVAVVGRFVLNGVSMYVSHAGAFRIQYEIRLGLAEHLANIPLGYVTRRRSGELKKVMADDVERLELFLAHAIPDLVAAIVTFFGLAIWMFWVDWRLAIATFALVVPAFACISLGMRRSGNHLGDYKAAQGQMNAAIVELIRGMPVVKMFNRDEEEVRGTEEMIRRYVDIVRSYSLEFLPYGTAFYVLLAANVMLIAPVGGVLWLTGNVSTADYLFFLIVGLGALSSLVSLLFLFANLSHIAMGGRLVQEVMAEARMGDAGQADAAPADHTVDFADVSFRYESEWVLTNFDQSFPANTLTALVGPSGSGKSTVASLIGRFFDPEKGRITLGGVDLRSVAPDDLSGYVTMVLQDTFLFDDTIEANLRVGKADATRAELESAAEAACIHETIAALPDGYETRVGEAGARLSGGERQRLAIARAILADTPVVVLDEATAFVDPDNEAAIQQALSRLIVGKTVIMIAHRLSTIAGADNIVVMASGEVVAQGTHQVLVDAGGLYARLWDDFNAAESTAMRETT